MDMLKQFYHSSVEKGINFITNNWHSVAWSILCYIIVFIFFMGFSFFTGVGKWFDVLFTFGIALLGLGSGLIATVVFLKILGRLPKLLVGTIVGAIVAIYSVGTYLGPFFRMMSFSILVMGTLTGFAFLFYRRGSKWLFTIFASFSILLHGLFFFVIMSQGEGGEWSLELADQSENHLLENPADTGGFSYKSFTYGSGDDQRRAEYREVEYVTDTVNVHPFIIRPKGLNKWYREWFWGFDLQKAPLNGRVWIPIESEKGPFPLVLMVHGNHNMVDFSDGGYEYLGEMLASKGYIAVSVDQNFLNSSKTGHVGWDNSGRAWMLLKHLEQWNSWNNDSNHALHNKVDMNNIALLGHSRGGEAVSIASLFNELELYPNNAKIGLNFEFSIKSLIGLSPGDGRFKPGDQPVELQNINYLTLQGANDTDHTNYLGMRQFERISFSQEFDGFKSSVYLYGANHGQFNSDWEVDQPSPYWWFMNRKEIMEPEQQREITKLYVAAFLDATLKNKEEYRQIFSLKETASPFIPTNPVRVRYEDSEFIPLATFEEDVDLTSVSYDGGSAYGQNLQVWKEINLTLRNKEPQGNQVVKLGWRSRNAKYSIQLPTHLSETLDDDSVLRFDAAQAHTSRYEFYGIPVPKGYKAKPIPIQVTFKSKSVNRLDGRIKYTVEIEPTLTSKLYKFDWWNERFGNEYEHMLQTYEIPLEFLKGNFPELDFTTINEIIFEFNQTESGLLFLDNIGFTE